jgi:hypothetical protein
LSDIVSEHSSHVRQSGHFFIKSQVRNRSARHALRAWLFPDPAFGPTSVRANRMQHNAYGLLRRRDGERAVQPFRRFVSGWMVVLPLRPDAIWSPAGWPDWANFRPMGNCSLWAVSSKIQKYIDQMLDLLLSPKKVTYKFWFKNGLGYISGGSFTNSSGHPGSPVSSVTNQFWKEVTEFWPKRL